jgi:heterodisulfide reductase subunit A-like polyferredoxin
MATQRRPKYLAERVPLTRIKRRARSEIRRRPMNPSVLIVGAGPVGLTLACELTRYRVPVRIVDKTSQRTDKSKAIVLWSRTLELLDRGDRGSSP